MGRGDYMIRKIEDDEEKITPIKEIVEIDGKVEISRQGDFLIIQPINSYFII
jgi:hypothetical protein